MRAFSCILAHYGTFPEIISVTYTSAIVEVLVFDRGNASTHLLKQSVTTRNNYYHENILKVVLEIQAEFCRKKSTL